MNKEKTMTCQSCGSDLLEGDKFCPQCGVERTVSLTCPKCNIASGQGSNFCSQCGTILSPESDGEKQADNSPAVVDAEPLVIHPEAKGPYLEIQNTSVSGENSRKFPLSGDEISIGRGGNTDIALSHDECVSLKHAVLTRQKDGWVIEDYKSRNGTFLAVVSPRLLADGDVIRIGDTSLVVHLEDKEG